MLTLPCTITFDGPHDAPIKLELDDPAAVYQVPPSVVLTPAQARALAADLESMADEWEQP